MNISSPLVAVCSTCGRPLNGKGNCLACLVSIGFNEPGEEAAASSDSLVFGDFEIARREDGSFCELGHGAMGVTYRATDKVLHRSVALKVIEVPAAAGSSDAVRERFLREARAAAALRHANVASVFNFGTAPKINRCYYAMELVEGETLEARVRRDGPLKVERALEIAIQVTRALIAAAAQNLIHRDLKPANIMLTPNDFGSEELEVKVIDFGLAKVAAEAASEKDITHGGFVGTPAFASPEQFGGQPADARSDIYSLGVTLWYALSGELPCPGRTIEEIRKCQTEGTLPVEQLAARKIPKPVISLLRRSLAVDPAQRPASARELLAALQSCRAQLASPNESKVRRAGFKWAAGILVAAFLVAALFTFRPPPQKVAPAPIPDKSIAVLPFENLSAEKDDAFFADGIQEDVLTTLGKIKELKVTPRPSVMTYRGTAVAGKLREIGQTLQVSHVLQGSVRRAATHVVINVALLDTRDDRQVWSERYERTLTDAISLEGELAVEIARELRATLTPAEKTIVGSKPTQNPDAYLFYLRARERETGYAKSDADLLAADQLYAQAIALDPKFALAHARRSILISKNGGKPDPADGPERKLKARAEADEALRSSPALGEAHLALAYYFYIEEDNPASTLKELARAETTSPNNGEIFWLRGACYRQQGRWREAIANYQRAQDLDPRNSEIAILNARNYRMVRDWPAAANSLNHALEIEPSSEQILIFLAGVEWYSGKANAWHAAFPRFPAGSENLPFLMGDQAMVDRDFAMAEKISQRYKDGEYKTYFHGCIALARGDVMAARRLFETLRPSFEARVREHPENAFERSDLGLLYAYLGRKEEAIREARRAVDLVPASKNAVDAPLLADMLALVYAHTGETDQAIMLIERLLTTPGAVLTINSRTHYGITLMDLRLRWEWDPLRNDPRFQKILAAPEPKTVY
jgi:serine/threonine protein kinase/Flp pilus assembly protein TadD